MILGDLVEFKTNSENSDFWLIRKGSENTVGKPTKEYSPEHIGVTIKDRSIIDPQYLYYYFMMLQSKGIFKILSKGTTNLKNIRLSDVKNIPVSM